MKASHSGRGGCHTRCMGGVRRLCGGLLPRKRRFRQSEAVLQKRDLRHPFRFVTAIEKNADHGGRIVKEQLIQQRTKEHPTFGCSFAYVGVQTQCTGTVRIIAPSPNDGNAFLSAQQIGIGLLAKCGTFTRRRRVRVPQ